MRQIPIPGVLQDHRGRWELTARVADPMDEVEVRRLAAGGGLAVFDAGSSGLRLFVRSRRPGDRLRPFGMAGRRKVQDILVDAHVPRDVRDEIPIVVDEAGRIVWVAGHVLAHEVRVTGATTGVLLLEFRCFGLLRAQGAVSGPEPPGAGCPSVHGRSG